MLKTYYILSTKHSHLGEFAFTFWGEDSCGYFFNLDDCQKYTHEEALKRAQSEVEFIVDCELIDCLSETYVFDNKTLCSIVRNTKENRELFGINNSNFLSRSLSCAYNKNFFMTPKEYLEKNKNCIVLYNKCRNLCGLGE